MGCDRRLRHRRHDHQSRLLPITPGVSLDSGMAALHATLRATVLAAVILGVTGIQCLDTRPLLVPPKVATEGPAGVGSVLSERVVRPWREEVETFVVAEPLRKLLRFPTAIANSFAPNSVPWLAVPPPPRTAGFTLDGSPSVFGTDDPLGTSLFLLLVAGAFCACVDTSTRAIAAASSPFSGSARPWCLRDGVVPLLAGLAVAVADPDRRRDSGRRRGAMDDRRARRADGRHRRQQLRRSARHARDHRGDAALIGAPSRASASLSVESHSPLTQDGVRRIAVRDLTLPRIAMQALGVATTDGAIARAHTVVRLTVGIDRARNAVVFGTILDATG